jgi:hypothetical protein
MAEWEPHKREAAIGEQAEPIDEGAAGNGGDPIEKVVVEAIDGVAAYGGAV